MAEIKGIDVSVWQGRIDWSKALRAGAQFAFIRAGIGNESADTFCDQNRAGCIANGIPFGLYWFMKPDKAWDKHAESFFAKWVVSPGALPPALDVETDGGLDKAELENWLLKATNRFEQLSGVQVAIYTRASFWDSQMPLTNWAKNRKLWVASWTTANEPTKPEEWEKRPWAFWQYSNKGDGSTFGCESNDVDMNRYNGSAEDFLRDFGQAVPVYVPELPDAIDPLFKVTPKTGLKWCNLRAGPSTDYADLGDLYAKSVVPVVKESGDWYKVEYWVAKSVVRKV